MKKLFLTLAMLLTTTSFTYAMNESWGDSDKDSLTHPMTPVYGSDDSDNEEGPSDSGRNSLLRSTSPSSFSLNESGTFDGDGNRLGQSQNSSSFSVDASGTVVGLTEDPVASHATTDKGTYSSKKDLEDTYRQCYALTKQIENISDLSEEKKEQLKKDVLGFKPSDQLRQAHEQAHAEVKTLMAELTALEKKVDSVNGFLEGYHQLEKKISSNREAVAASKETIQDPRIPFIKFLFSSEAEGSNPFARDLIRGLMVMSMLNDLSSGNTQLDGSDSEDDASGESSDKSTQEIPENEAKD